MASASASGMWERHVPGISDFRLLYRMKWIQGEKLRTYVTWLWVRALKVLHENAKYAMMRKRIGLVAPGLRGEDWYFVDEGELLSVEEITRILKVSILQTF